MKQLFAYIRVSDPKQGKGVSLVEQRSIIDTYAAHIGVTITDWFVETRTAAKTGRPVFERMVKLIRAAKADGFIVHKLDRTTRNWYDWAEINELLDRGVDIHVASEHVELRSNGSRLAADMEIVVAVHYIRNLRQEALKGIHGRLQQGILPNAASVGYMNCGAGKPKTIDPVKGPLVARLFTMYAGGGYTLRELAAEAQRIGLRNRSGRSYTFQQVSNILRNPFYMGVIRSRRYGLFPGKHEPLVSSGVFQRVQTVLAGKAVRKTKRFTFLFRRFIHCQTCKRPLSGSERKGRVYYRCPTMSCPTTSLREDVIDRMMRDALRAVCVTDREAEYLQQEIAAYSANEKSLREAKRAALNEALRAVNARMSRLTDLLLDGKIDTAAHDEKRTGLVVERQRLTEELAVMGAHETSYLAQASKIFELLKSAETLYESADDARKRRLLEIAISNCSASGKTLTLALREPFATLANRRSVNRGGQFYDTDRTFVVQAIISWAVNCSEDAADALQSISASESSERQAA